MTTSTSSASNARDDREQMRATWPEQVIPLSEPSAGHEDPYAENELITRHERTERAIRKAQEQS
jgi:hypothetical protein